MSNNHLNSEKAHPFELSGMGTGPYRFIGIVSLPSPSLAEANPTAYNAALAHCAQASAHVSGGLGTCRHCGMGIMHNCIVKDAQGVRYAVGSDCILKTDDPSLGNAVKVTLARQQAEIRRQKRDAKREAQRVKWLATTCNDRGETNAQRIERENAEREQAELVKKQASLQRFGFLLPMLDSMTRTNGDFCFNMAERIRNGHELDGRPLQIVGEIYAKQFGRYGSKAYEAAYEEFELKVA